MIKDILLHLSNDPRNGARIQAALQLAQKHQAHVTALYTAPLPDWPATAEGYIPPGLIERISADARRLADEQKKNFAESCRKQKIKYEWRFVEDEPLLVLPEQGRQFDLIIVGQAEENGESDHPSGDIGLAEEATMGAGRPVLVIPYAGKFKTIGSRILIAWNGSREATRAIHDAVPLLQSARKVTLLSVNSPNENHGPDPDIRRHLARWGIKVEMEHTVAKDIDVADVLLNAAADRNIDLLVMGAYGHSRFREFVLGGVTRDILSQMTVPVLLSH